MPRPRKTIDPIGTLTSLLERMREREEEVKRLTRDLHDMLAVVVNDRLYPMGPALVEDMLQDNAAYASVLRRCPPFRASAKWVPLGSGEPATVAGASGRAGGRRPRFDDGELPRRLRAILAQHGGWMSRDELAVAVAEERGARPNKTLLANVSKRLSDMTRGNKLTSERVEGLLRWRVVDPARGGGAQADEATEAHARVAEGGASP
ncbi:MAG: hypothetical protein HQL39_15500 [Alphaproteobacteria bacterium]|nr:hypothetical protein [Alphaproteobacteria bacterium]